MKLTTNEIIETFENFKAWAYIEDLFGDGISKASYYRVEAHLLKLLDRAEQYEAYNVFYDHIDSDDGGSYSQLVDSLDLALDALHKRLEAETK